jgi:hypothetical protein
MARSRERSSWVTNSARRAGVIFALLLVAPAFGDVIFSRRVYQEHVASFQQIWTWNPADGVLKQLTRSLRDHYHPACDGTLVKFTTDDAKLWSFNSATGDERIVGTATEPTGRPHSRLGNCAQFAKRGEIEACGNEETLIVSRSGREIGRFQIQADKCPIGKCATPIRSLEWTEDGKWLLIGEQGLNDGSGSRQEDYYLVNVATMKLSTVASAETAFWLPRRDQVVYVTPQDLAPLPGGQRKHNVWVQQLMFFDPLKGTPTAITSGLTNNVDPSWCEGAQTAHSDFRSRVGQR